MVAVYLYESSAVFEFAQRPFADLLQHVFRRCRRVHFGWQLRCRPFLTPDGLIGRFLAFFCECKRSIGSQFKRVNSKARQRTA